MNLGAFAVVIWLRRQGGEFLDIRDYQGLARRHPGAAAAMAVFMLSLAGIPPTAGFFGKLYLFLPVVGSGNASLIALAAIGLVVSVVGVFYYLRIIVQMYFQAPEQDFVGVSPSTGVRVTAAICAIATLVLGVLPIRGLAPNASGENRAAPVAPAATITAPVSRQVHPTPKTFPDAKNPRAVSQR
jgi:NADH-quinone oxidoreductase subunit N